MDSHPMYVRHPNYPNLAELDQVASDLYGPDWRHEAAEEPLAVPAECAALAEEYDQWLAGMVVSFAVS